jgi:hypothetical protein
MAMTIREMLLACRIQAIHQILDCHCEIAGHKAQPVTYWTVFSPEGSRNALKIKVVERSGFEPLKRNRPIANQ